jgi:hypothetical protein
MPAQLTSCREHIEETDFSPALFRTDIEFFNVGANEVAIEIEVTNLSGRLSPPSSAVVMAAPFGAFVPWQPVVTLPVPRLAPGKVQLLRTTALAIQPEPLGSPDRVPPRRLLTALALEDDSPRKRSGKENTGRKAGADVLSNFMPGTRALPADLMKMILQSTPHWIGNINVMVGQTDVERHLARAVRVYPGRVNMAWFFVGSAGRDAYAFRLEGVAEDWQARLFDMTARDSLVLDVNKNPELAPEVWIETTHTRCMLLALQPPKSCPAGTIKVHVTQRSTGRTAVVEFSLDPRAAGRGCYVV